MLVIVIHAPLSFANSGLNIIRKRKMKHCSPPGKSRMGAAPRRGQNIASAEAGGA
jgi:hypothetical protein